MRERKHRPSAGQVVPNCHDRFARTIERHCVPDKSRTTMFHVRHRTASPSQCQSPQLVGGPSTRRGHLQSHSSSHVSAAGTADREQRRSEHHQHQKILQKVIRRAGRGHDSRLWSSILSGHESRRDPEKSRDQRPTTAFQLSKSSFHSGYRIRPTAVVATFARSWVMIVSSYVLANVAIGRRLTFK